MKITLAIALLFSVVTSFAQRQNYDLTSFVPPNNWVNEVKAGTYTCFTTTNKKKKSYCRIFIMASIDSKGDLNANFDNEWQNLVASQYSLTQPAQLSNPETKEGWESMSGWAPFTYNNGKSTATLYTYTGYGKTVSIVTLTNSAEYTATVSRFLASVQISQPVAATEPTEKSAPATTSSNFAFTHTDFDDGWKSVVKEDWVEVTKGNVVVLLHYPKAGTVIPADPEPFISNAWNILVAPRYRDLKNYQTAYITEYERPYLGFGQATEISTSKEVYVVLFRKGASGFIECITPDKKTFVQNFGFDPGQIRWDSEGSLMNPLLQLSGYNKFAVAATDLTGTWTSDFSGMQQLYSVYTGQYAGMNVNQSSQTFEFGPGNSYNWKIVAVNGMVGSLNYGKANSSGKFTVVNNWQISFSDMEGKPRLYNAWFSCIKGGRMLWIVDAQNGGAMATGFGKK